MELIDARLRRQTKIDEPARKRATRRYAERSGR